MNVFELEASLKLKKDEYTGSLSDARGVAADFEKDLSGLESTADSVAGNFEKAMDGVSDSFEDVASSAESAGGDIADTFGDTADSASGSLEGISDTADDVSGDVASAFDDMAEGVSMSFDDVVDSADQAAGDVSDALSNVDISGAESQIDSLADKLSSDLSSAASDAGQSIGGLSEPFGDVSGEASGLGGVVEGLTGTFGGAFGSMSQIIQGAGLVGALAGIGAAAAGIATDIAEAAIQWEESCDAITLATGFVGEELDNYAAASKEAYQTTQNMEASQVDIAAITGEVATLFGTAADETGVLTARIADFAYAAGVDGVQATDGLYRVMQLWGDEAGNVNEVTDKLTKATQDSGISANTLMNILSKSHGTLEDMGMGFDEAVGFIDAYIQAGGNADVITRGLATAESNLINSGVTDIPSVFNAAIETIGEYSSMSEAMNATIEGTDLLVSDVFGSGRMGQQLIDPFLNGKFAAEEWTASIQNSNDTIATTLGETTSNLDAFSKQFEVGKNELGSMAYEAADMIVGAAFLSDGVLAQTLANLTGNYTIAGAKAMEHAGIVGESMSSVEDSITTSSEEGGTATDGLNKKWQDNANLMNNTRANIDVDGTPGNRGLEAFSNGFSRRMGSLNQEAVVNVKVHGSFPNIVQSTANGGIRYSIAGYTHFARGYNEAMLLTRPTIFGTNGGTALVGGDGSGGEIVSGEAHLLGMMNDVVNSSTAKIVDLLARYLPDIAQGQAVYLDGKELTDNVSRRLGRQVVQRRAVG